MGFSEDDRIRRKNAKYQNVDVASTVNYKLVLDKAVDVSNIAGALRECGFEVEVEANTVKITG